MNEYLEKISRYIMNTETKPDESELEVMMYEIRDELEENNIGLDCVEPILRLMECYPCLQFGSPGVLTHYMERFFKKGHEILLEESILRTPTVHTVWLLNRIINGVDNETHKKYKEMLVAVVDDPMNPLEVKRTAKDFYMYQEGIDK